MNAHAAHDPQLPDDLAGSVEAAIRQIPPMWPLDAQVAVNPYLGQVHAGLAEAGARLTRLGAGPVTMPRQWYLDRLAHGTITDADLDFALAASPYPGKPLDVAALEALARQPRPPRPALPTIAELAARHSGIDWPAVMANQIGVWAGSYFDAGQALWIAPQGRGAWSAYRIHATHDITPEIMGLAGFAAFVADAPESPLAAIARAVGQLGLSETALESYCHRLLLSLGGWAQLARYRLWRAELANDSDTTLTELLAIRLLWEEALHTRYGDAIAERWAGSRDAYAQVDVPAEADIVDEILQEAAERAAQRGLGDALAVPVKAGDNGRPLLQAVFCIDVRSEVFRRALERVDPSIRTLGFAGFFGIFAKHRRFASDVDELRLPALLEPTLQSCATGPDNENEDRDARLRARASRAWGRFKLAAVSSFAFVEAMGRVYVFKLLRDALGQSPREVPAEPKPHFVSDLDLGSRITMAATVLRAMSLTHDLARIIVLAGHGATVVNNPHASGLQCGACGGYSGEVNARLLASLLNDPDVRAGLGERGIEIPFDTLFVAARHDTTTDAVTLYDRDLDTSMHAEVLEQIRGWLTTAGRAARAERALRLPQAKGESDIPRRARNWAEVRPEWGLAGCQAFIAAPRARTCGRHL